MIDEVEELNIGVCAELAACRADFAYWCERWAWIEDKESARPIPMRLFSCQRLLARWLQDREWLRILKARRLGVTWLCALYSVWLMSCFRMKTVGFVVHKVEFAKDFIGYCKFVMKRLPDWMRPVPVTDNKGTLEFEHEGRKSWIRAFAATSGAADSVAADVFIVDQAPQIEELKPGLLKTILRSSGPTVETSRGHIIQIGTSIGPTGYFHSSWEDTDRNSANSRYKNVFWSWRERPGRDSAWYERETADHHSDALYMPREYPETAEEAFSIAEGRIYPTFRKTQHVLRFGPHAVPFKVDDAAFPLEPCIEPEWPCWRGVDWGGRDPMVALWVCMIPGLGPSLVVDPQCVNLIREMMAYHYKPGSAMIADIDDHGCFVAGTRVETLHGPRAIEAVRVGEVVRSHLGWTRVAAAECTGVRPLVRLTLSGPSGVRGPSGVSGPSGVRSTRGIVCSPEHPLALAGGGWVRADEAEGRRVDTRCQSKEGTKPPAGLASVKRWRSRLGTRRRRLESAPASARRGRDPFPGWMTGIGSASDAAGDFGATGTARRNRARTGVRPRRVLRVDHLGRSEAVYNLATDDGTYFANGVLVSNCDVLRYVVATFGLHNCVYVYREMYLKNPANNEIAVPHFADEIARLTGRHEDIRMTVYDRSRPSDAVILRQHLTEKAGRKQRVIPHTAPQGQRARSMPEKEQGIDRVNTLIIGTKDIFALRKRDPLMEAFHDEFVKDPTLQGAAISMEVYMRQKSLKRRMLDKRKEAERRARSQRQQSKLRRMR